jgi:hypothetical protein
VTVLESIMEDLKTLTVPRLVEVAGYVHRLNPNVEKRRREALSATAGSLCGSEGEDFERAVKEEAERIDNDVS